MIYCIFIKLNCLLINKITLQIHLNTMILPGDIINFIFNKLPIEHRARTFVNKKYTILLYVKDREIISNIKNKKYEDVLIGSAKYGYIKTVKYLYNNVNIRECCDEAVLEASIHGQLDIVKYLYDNEYENLADMTFYNVICASEYGHLDILMYLCNIEYNLILD